MQIFGSLCHDSFKWSDVDSFVKNSSNSSEDEDEDCDEDLLENREKWEYYHCHQHYQLNIKSFQTIFDSTYAMICWLFYVQIVLTLSQPGRIHSQHLSRARAKCFCFSTLLRWFLVFCTTWNVNPGEDGWEEQTRDNSQRGGDES